MVEAVGADPDVVLQAIEALARGVADEVIERGGGGGETRCAELLAHEHEGRAVALGSADLPPPPVAAGEAGRGVDFGFDEINPLQYARKEVGIFVQCRSRRGPGASHVLEAFVVKTRGPIRGRREIGVGDIGPRAVGLHGRECRLRVRVDRGDGRDHAGGFTTGPDGAPIVKGILAHARSGITGDERGHRGGFAGWAIPPLEHWHGAVVVCRGGSE